MLNIGIPMKYPVLDSGVKHARFINITSKLASITDPVDSSRIAASLVLKNDIVAFGTCKKKSHPFQATYSQNSESIYLHAETDCIKNALRVIDLDDLSKCTLYIVRVKFDSPKKKKFIFGLAKPCSGCMKAIVNFSIKKVVYSLDNEGYAQL
jgi:deoxycytidylate deaminase